MQHITSLCHNSILILDSVSLDPISRRFRLLRHGTNPVLLGLCWGMLPTVDVNFHKQPRIRQLLEDIGVKVIFLGTYDPQVRQQKRSIVDGYIKNCP